MRVRIAQASDDLALQKLKATTSPRYPDHAPEPGQVVLVATESVRSVFGYLVGTVQGAYSGSGRPTPPPHGYLQTIAVATGVRRQGIGSRLVETFVESAVQQPWPESSFSQTRTPVSRRGCGSSAPAGFARSPALMSPGPDGALDLRAPRVARRRMKRSDSAPGVHSWAPYGAFGRRRQQRAHVSFAGLRKRSVDGGS